MATKLEPPNGNELAWIADNVARGRAMAEKYGGLDAVWTAFGASLRDSKDDPNFLINMIGLALGQRFVDGTAPPFGGADGRDHPGRR